MPDNVSALNSHAVLIEQIVELRKLLREIAELDKAGMLCRDPLDTDVVFDKLHACVKEGGDG